MNYPGCCHNFSYAIHLSKQCRYYSSAVMVKLTPLGHNIYNKRGRVDDAVQFDGTRRTRCGYHAILSHGSLRIIVSSQPWSGICCCCLPIIMEERTGIPGGGGKL
eukprot:scaffold2657_cov89-Amphora_coffeaeformis.AAC.15